MGFSILKHSGCNFGPPCVGLMLILGGCVTSPDSQVDEIQIAVPEYWHADAHRENFQPQTWMRDIADPQLEEILREALEHNFSLAVAQARLEASLAGSKSTQSAIWPTLDASGSFNESRRSSASGISQTPVSKTYGLNGRFNWEVDLWGKLRHAYRGGMADAEAAIADYQATRLSIAGRTAQAWYQAIAAQQLLDFADNTLETFRSSQRIVEEGFERGIGGALDVRLVRANVASAASDRETALRTHEAAVRNLEQLLGRYPANELKIAATWPEINPSIPTGLPSELLLRRPDLLAAERELAAAEQRKFEAKKAMLPNLSLTLNRGTSATDFNDLFDFDRAKVWSRIWSLSLPIFQGGRLKANSARAQALHRQAVANYTEVALTAFREVENALSAQSSYQRDYALQRIATEESVAAEKLAWEQYENGLTDITTVLDSVRRAIAAQRSLIQVTNQRIQSRIDLYLALGGGFEVDYPESP